MIKKNDYQLYFLNDLYDDEIISNSMDSYRNTIYEENLRNKKYIQNNFVINGSVSDITIDFETNVKYNMPFGTYSIRFHRNFVPFFSEKEFPRHYHYGDVISYRDLLDDSVVFSKSFFFFVNDMFIYDIKLVMTYHECILFIPVSDGTVGVNKEEFGKYLSDQTKDGTWTMYFTTKADYYYGFQQRAQLFTDNKIYLSKLTEGKTYNKPVKNNYWTLYLSGSASSANMMIATSVTLNKDNVGSYFEIPDGFKKEVDTVKALKCLVVNEPECGGTGYYGRDLSADPIFQIPFKKNPIAINNITVWKYDKNTGRKLHPLVNNATMKYPNIYNFSNLLDPSYYTNVMKDNDKLVIGSNIITKKTTTAYDLFMEWIEPMEDNAEYDSYIHDYVECYGDKYAEMVLSGSTHPLIQKYDPINDTEITTEDYMNSDLKGDYRAWRLSKFIRLLKDNPHRYDLFFERLYQKIKKFISKSYDYTSHPHIYDRSIMNNLDHCNEGDEKAMYFKEPHAYVHFYNASGRNLPCTLFIDGVRKTITYIMDFGSDLYVYFPASYIANHESIQIDADLEVDPNIETHTLEMNHLYRHTDLDELPFVKYNSLANLIYYMDETGDYIPYNAFEVTLQTSLVKLYYNEWDNTDWVVAYYTDYDLIDNKMRYVVPTDGVSIVVKVEEMNFVVSTEGNTSQKVIDLNDIDLKLVDESYFDHRIGISTSNQRYTVVKTIDDTYIKENGNRYIMKNFKGKPKKERFHIYFDGIYVNPSKYSITFTGYNKDAVILFTDNIPNCKMNIDVLSYDEDIVYNGKISALEDTSDGMMYLSSLLKSSFNPLIYKVYIDGYRIPCQYLKEVEQANIIYVLNQLGHKFTDDSTIVILKQTTDVPVYEYANGEQFLTTVIKDDETFRNYVIDKYKK